MAELALLDEKKKLAEDSAKRPDLGHPPHAAVGHSGADAKSADGDQVIEPDGTTGGAPEAGAGGDAPTAPDVAPPEAPAGGPDEAPSPAPPPEPPPIEVQ